MIIVLFLFGALALLVTLLLFGFVGCGLDTFGTGPFQDYPTTIESTPDLVAYWRLGEPSSTPVPSSGGAAKSQVGGFNGDYFKLSPIATPDNQRHSPITAGMIILGETPGLLQLLQTSPCIDSDGGFVQVPFDPQLNPPQFTLEAWVSPDPFMAKGFFHCLVESTGPQGLGPKKTGWGLYLGPDNPTKSPPDDYFWQVWMGDGSQFKRVAIANGTDCPTQLRLTYLVLTFDGTNLQLWLFYPDTQQQLDVKHLRGAQNPSVTTFHMNDTSSIGKGDFFIGTGSNLFPNVGPPPHRLYPFKGKIQEVALYKRSLVGPPPNFDGLSSTLGIHESAGGNF